MSDELPLVAPAPSFPDEGARPAPVVSQEVTLLTILNRAAADPQTDVDKLERLVALYERSQARDAHAAYTNALAQMQPELPEIEEHGAINIGSGKRQTYAKWEDIQDAIKPILAKHGFSLTFSIGGDGEKISVTAKLSHRAGHVEETTLPLPLDTSGSKNIVQAHGSSVSYGQRYTAIALLNITSRGTDDDGVAGGTKLVTEPELEILRSLLGRADVKEAAFCTHLKIEGLDHLPAHRFRYAEEALRGRIKKREEESVARNRGRTTRQPRVVSGAAGPADSERVPGHPGEGPGQGAPGLPDPSGG